MDENNAIYNVPYIGTHNLLVKLPADTILCTAGRYYTFGFTKDTPDTDKIWSFTTQN